MKMSNRQAPSKKKRTRFADPSKYIREADLESISLTDRNGTLTPYNQALAEQRVRIRGSLPSAPANH